MRLLKSLTAGFFLFISLNALSSIHFEKPTTSASEFARLIDIEKAKISDESYRVLHNLDIEIKRNTVKTHVKTAWYFSSVSDIQDFGQSSIGFNENTQKVKVIHAITVSPNGDVHNLSEQDSKLIDSNTYNVFSSWQELLLNFPKLEEGGFTFLEYEVITDKSEMELDWSTTQFPQIYNNTGQYYFSISWDSDNLEPSISTQSDFVNCEHNNKNMTCTGRNIPAAKTDTSVSAYDQLGFIEAGELNHWSDITTISSSMFNSAYAKNTKKMNTFLAKNLKKDYSKEEALNFIHQYVARKVQYLSKSEHGHAVTPHKTEETLEKMIGDCKDKTALFIDLAKQVGIDAYPVLISTSRQSLNSAVIPSLRKFNHVVACYEIAKKKYCSDLTDAYTDWRDTSSWIQGKMSLPIVKNGTPELLQSDTFRWKYEIDSIVTFLDDGGQDEEQTRTHANLYSSWYKSVTGGKNKDEITRWLIENYNDVVAEKVTPEFTVEGLNTMEDQVIIHSKTHFTPFFDISEGLNYSENDAWLSNEVKNNYPTNKFYGEHINGTQASSKFTYKLPPQWEITIKPADISLNHRFGSLHRESFIDTSNNLLVKTELKLPAQYIKPEDLKNYSKFLDTIKAELTIKVIGNTKI